MFHGHGGGGGGGGHGGGGHGGGHGGRGGRGWWGGGWWGPWWWDDDSYEDEGLMELAEMDALLDAASSGMFTAPGTSEEAQRGVGMAAPLGAMTPRHRGFGMMF